MIPESFIEELKYRSDIEQIVSPYVRLKRSGRNLTGLCPFHSEKSPSFVVYPENQSFYCFGCGAGGDIITFVRQIEHLEYVEALRFLAEKAGMTLPEDARDDETARVRLRVLELNREAARFFHSVLISPAGKPGLDYLRGRGLAGKTIRRFGLGYAPGDWSALLDHLREKGFSEQEMLLAAVVSKGRNGGVYDTFRGRVIFPIIDLRGGVIGFGGRILGEDGPKYLNSADTPVFKKSRGLFAMNIAKATKENRLILAEGYMDVIAIHQAGFDNAVATLGTALTPEQARLISQYTGEVIIAYDSDGPGQKATMRATGLLGQTGVKIRVLAIKDAKDPDEYIKKFGATRFKMLLDASANSTEFEILRIRQKYDLSTDDGKVGFLREFAAAMAALPDRLEADVYIGRIAAELTVSRSALTEQVAALRKKNFRAREKKERRDLKIYSEAVPNQPRDPQRSKYLRYALAEDKLIALLMKNPDYGAEICEKITPGEFVTDANREIFSVIANRISQSLPVDLMSLSSSLPMEAMGRLSYLLASSEARTYTIEEANDYIDVILSFRQTKTGDEVGCMPEDELLEYIQKLASKKK
ncbi:MAG TPA: DNA primase [Candidatus Fimivivens faecavium]|nr:DNA primase [Candidatus Fimivivens faecavium]